MQACFGEEQMRQLHEVLCDCLSSSEEKTKKKAVDLNTSRQNFINKIVVF